MIVHLITDLGWTMFCVLIIGPSDDYGDVLVLHEILFNIIMLWIGKSILLMLNALKIVIKI